MDNAGHTLRGTDKHNYAPVIRDLNVERQNSCCWCCGVLAAGLEMQRRAHTQRRARSSQRARPTSRCPPRSRSQTRPEPRTPRDAPRAPRCAPLRPVRKRGAALRSDYTLAAFEGLGGWERGAFSQLLLPSGEVTALDHGAKCKDRGLRCRLLDPTPEQLELAVAQKAVVERGLDRTARFREQPRVKAHEP